MAKKKFEHGPLYENAKRELELAGITVGKGNTDQILSSTVLKLIDVFEQRKASKLVGGLIINLFTRLSQGELINPPTDNPDEWKLVPGLGDAVCVNRYSSLFFSKDGGVSWYRTDTGEHGLSKEYEEVSTDASEEKERV